MIDTSRKRKGVFGIAEPTGTIDAFARRVVAAIYPIISSIGWTGKIFGRSSGLITKINDRALSTIAKVNGR